MSSYYMLRGVTATHAVRARAADSTSECRATWVQLSDPMASLLRTMRHQAFLFLVLACSLQAQQPPYDVFPPAEPPYYRMRYEASTKAGGLAFPVNYTVWVPPGVKSLRGLIV